MACTTMWKPTVTNPSSWETVTTRPCHVSITSNRLLIVILKKKRAPVNRTVHTSHTVNQVVSNKKAVFCSNFSDSMSFANPKCMWCKEGFTPNHSINDYFESICCKQFYHGTCRALHNWWLKPSQRRCPHCKTVNFGEPHHDIPKTKS